MSSDGDDSEDDVPVKLLRAKFDEKNAKRSKSDAEIDDGDSKMTVESVEDSDEDWAPRPEQIRNTKRNLIKNRTSKSTTEAEKENSMKNVESDEVSSSDTEGEIPDLQSEPVTHRNQYFKSFKFGPHHQSKLPDIVMPEGYGEPISVVPIKQEYDDDEDLPAADDDETDDPPKVKVELEIEFKPKNKKIKNLTDEELEAFNTRFVFLCQMCRESFTNMEDLKAHLTAHDQKGTYMCKTCERVYQSIKDLRLHMICHVKIGNFKCEDCGKLYHHTQSLLAHRKRWHSADRPHFCDICGRSYSLKTDLNTHMRTHSDERYQCEYCNKAFRTDRYLRLHTKHVHLGIKHTLVECNICHKSYQKKNLLTHKKLHEQKLHKCHYCGKCMTTSYSLIAHIRRHEGVKPFVCNICEKAFVDKGKLARHLHTHSGTKDFQCDICEKSFSESQYLRQHKRTHDHSKKYPCKVCGSLFKSMNSVWSHMRKHTHKNRYECHFCGKTCYRPDHLRSHLVSHTGIKEFQCEICSKRFAKAYDLTEHRRSHSGERPYVCKVCNRSFARHGEFRRHQTRKYHLDRLREKGLSVETNKSEETIREVPDSPGVPERNPPSSSYRCTPCGKSFSSAESFAIHCKEEPHTDEDLAPTMVETTMYTDD